MMSPAKYWRYALYYHSLKNPDASKFLANKKTILMVRYYFRLHFSIVLHNFMGRIGSKRLDVFMIQKLLVSSYLAVSGFDYYGYKGKSTILTSVEIYDYFWKI